MAKPIYGLKPNEWGKHLRRSGKKEFWNRLRTMYAKKIHQEIKELQTLQALENGTNETN